MWGCLLGKLSTLLTQREGDIAHCKTGREAETEFERSHWSKRMPNPSTVPHPHDQIQAFQPLPTLQPHNQNHLSRLVDLSCTVLSQCLASLCLSPMKPSLTQLTRAQNTWPGRRHRVCSAPAFELRFHQVATTSFCSTIWLLVYLSAFLIPAMERAVSTVFPHFSLRDSPQVNFAGPPAFLLYKMVTVTVTTPQVCSADRIMPTPG